CDLASRSAGPVDVDVKNRTGAAADSSRLGQGFELLLVEDVLALAGGVQDVVETGLDRATRVAQADPTRPHELKRVDRVTKTTLVGLEVEVRAGHVTGCTLGADALTSSHSLAGTHGDSVDRVVAVVGVRAAAVVDDDTDTGTAAQDVPANALDAAVGGSEGRATTGDVDTGMEASPAWTEQRREWTNRGTAPLAAARRRGAERATAAGEAWRLSHLRDDALDVGLHGRVARRGPPAPHVAVVGPGRVEVCGGDLLPVAVALPGAHRVAPGALVLNLARCQVGAGIAAVVGPRRVDVLVGARGGGDRDPRPVVVAGLVQAQRVEVGTNRTGVHRPTADPAEETGDGVADLVDGELWDAGDQLAEGSVLGEVAQAPN